MTTEHPHDNSPIGSSTPSLRAVSRAGESLHDNCRDLCVLPSVSLRKAIEVLDYHAKRIVLVTDDENKLVATLTDGDVRRAVLAGISLDDPLDRVLEQKQNSARRKPVSALATSSVGELLAIMEKHNILHVPLLTDQGRVAGLAALDELSPTKVKPQLGAVVMAGGFGKRLRPLTDNMPKPMLPVGETPLLELTINRLRSCGIQDICLTTHYMPEKIASHFGDGEEFGVNIEYVNEDVPLGTAGGLSLIAKREGPTVVMNGDVMTDINFDAFYEYHCQHEGCMTIAARHFRMNVPYGVVDYEGHEVRQIVEKPSYDFFVNAGIYILEAEARAFVRSKERLDMPDLAHQLIESGKKVLCFPLLEQWLDIGLPEDYATAQQIAQGKRRAA